MPVNSLFAYQVQVSGLVQGIGFRPFIYRLAHRVGLKGWVRNTSTGVLIRIEGTQAMLQRFLKEMPLQAPPAAIINGIHATGMPVSGFESFDIVSSKDDEGDITLVSPDIAVCDQCLDDLQHQPHRTGYPFINCTYCGPRFSIIRDLPYDRVHTTMDVFPMCPVCKAEYTNILDRRFHAQPVACNTCGPKYTLHLRDKKIHDFRVILETVSALIARGGILAVKGIGGFHLMCSAMDQQAIETLRKNKLREQKPFAVMFRDLETLKRYAFVDEAEEKSLLSWQRPIVLLKTRKPLAPSVSNDFPTLGAMLPYTPFHYLFFMESPAEAVVLTSGNISEEPIVTADQVALQTFGPWCDGVLDYNRAIHNRNDDSVVMVVNDIPRLIRRSRGYAPLPVNVQHNVEGIVAAGAELVNCFAVGRRHYAFLSQHIGDLKNFETYEFYTESLERFQRLFRVTPRFVAADLHPDYLSTQYAMKSGLPVMQFQHHHAHIASCMAENGVSEQVIGVAFDGTGLGDDGTIWGGEFLVCDFNHYERITHLPYIALPGGDAVTKEPWRTALGVVFSYATEALSGRSLPFLRHTDPGKTDLVLQALQKQVNVPLSCSAGRWFDAVAALAGISFTTGFHAEAPMRLEAFIDPGIQEAYPYLFRDQTIDFSPTVQAILEDARKEFGKSLVASRFHNTMIALILEVVKSVSAATGIRKVALSGGCFQNRYLLGRVENGLEKQGFIVLSHRQVPANDGGLALGQMLLAACREQHNQ